MARGLDASTATATTSAIVNWVYFIRLDIKDDPIVAWSGWGDLAMTGTNDAAMDGQTFMGITHLVGEISPATDSEGGSQALVLTLPGVSLQDPALRQVVYDRRQWQFRRAWVWVALLNEAGQIIGKPFRVKTGRIDTMSVEEDEGGTGYVKCQIESGQAYAGEALNTRYSEQTELDSSDTSQAYVWSLANITPAIGQATSATASYSAAMSGAVGGSVGDYGRANERMAW